MFPAELNDQSQRNVYIPENASMLFMNFDVFGGIKVRYSIMFALCVLRARVGGFKQHPTKNTALQ